MKTTLTFMKRIVKTGKSYTAEIYGRMCHCTVATFGDGTSEIIAICDIVSCDGRKFLSRTPR